MKHVTPMKRHRKPFGAVVPMFVPDNLTMVVLVTIGVAALMLIVAVVAAYSQAQTRRFTTRHYTVAERGEAGDGAAFITMVLIVVGIVVAAKFIGVKF
jgi:uncharacterized membrane protein